MDKLSNNMFTGPYQVLDISEDGSLVCLELPKIFGTGPTWTSVQNVKHVVFTKNGDLFVSLPSDVIEE